MGYRRMIAQASLTALVVLLFCVPTGVLAWDDCGSGDNPPCPPSEIPPGYAEDAEERSPQRLKLNIKQITGPIGSRSAQAVEPGSDDTFRRPIFSGTATESLTGLSAGDFVESLSDKLGIWANLSYITSEDDSPQTRSDADLYNFIVGSDYRLSDRMIVGLAFTYEDMDRTTDYNSGEVQSDGFTLSPYFAMLINDYFGFDLNTGYSWTSLDQVRRDEGYSISSSPDAERFFVNLNANGYYYIDNWNIGATLGYIYAKEDQDAFGDSSGIRYSASTVKLGQAYLNAEASYAFESIEPYLGLGYEYDMTYDENKDTFGAAKDEDFDSDGFTFALGARFLLLDTLQGDFGFTGVFSRENYSEYGVALNVRYDF